MIVISMDIQKKREKLHSARKKKDGKPNFNYHSKLIGSVEGDIFETRNC
jgi:hypothetical protein